MQGLQFRHAAAGGDDQIRIFFKEFIDLVLMLQAVQGKFF